MLPMDRMTTSATEVVKIFEPTLVEEEVMEERQKDPDLERVTLEDRQVVPTITPRRRSRRLEEKRGDNNTRLHRS